LRYLAVLDGTGGAAEPQAQALAGFLAGGLAGVSAGETLILYADERDRDELVALAPTAVVRLIKVEARRPDRAAELLAAEARIGDAELLLFGGGACGTELATRVACRSGGAVFSEALELTAAPDGLMGRRAVYSNHLSGRFALEGRPCCVTIDASWRDAPPASAPGTRTIARDTDETGAAGPSPFEAIALERRPDSGELAAARLLVVAGRGAGSRGGVERLAAAARRMGAAFGVTRPVAMNAWAPMERIVGVSGARTAPDVCIVAGASGAPAFFWGIERAAFIAAVDRDDAAPVLGEADVAVVEDAVAFVEALAELVTGERGDHDG
jgi:electron transfer flavoprotein alpha subunit